MKRSVFDQKFVEFGRSGFGVTAFRKSPSVLVIGLRHRNVPGQVVIGHAAVRAALDVGVAAQALRPPPGRPMLPSSSCSIAAA